MSPLVAKGPDKMLIDFTELGKLCNSELDGAVLRGRRLVMGRCLVNVRTFNDRSFSPKQSQHDW